VLEYIMDGSTRLVSKVQACDCKFTRTSGSIWTVRLNPPFHRVVYRVALLGIRITALLMCVSLLLLSSCATAPNPYLDDSIRPTLPAQTSFNQSAGHGDLIYLALRLGDGEELFALDTGSPLTVLDRALEPKLDRRLGRAEVFFPMVGAKKGHAYAAPRLFLGDTQLATGTCVVTDDLERLPFPNRQVKGILGMDCLRHYCLQIDFQSRNIRFLDPDDDATAKDGRAFPLSFSSGLVKVFVDENLLGVKNSGSLIDTGDNGDGDLESKLFLEALQDHRGIQTDTFVNSTRRATPAICLKEVVFGGESYSDVKLGQSFGFNSIGLRFLARHRVTFNFPKRMMYLQRE
jgi:hypothetical protein